MAWMLSNQIKTRAGHRWMCAMYVMISMVLLTTSVDAGSIRLLSKGLCQTAKVKLGDVASLKGKDAQWLKDLVIDDLTDHKGKKLIRIEDLRKQLTQAGVNWADMSLGGFGVCNVKQIESVSYHSSRFTTHVRGEKSNKQNKLAVTHRVVKDVVKARLTAFTGFDKDELKFVFHQKDRGMLEEAAGVDQFEVTPSTNRKLGKIRVNVLRYRDSKLIDHSVVTVVINRKVSVLVAKRLIRRGEVFSTLNTEFKKVLVDSEHKEYIASYAALENYAAKYTIESEKWITPRNMLAKRVVTRGQMVQVKRVVGGMVVTAYCKALKNGVVGELIEVMNLRSKEKLFARVVGVRMLQIDQASKVIGKN